MNIFNTKQVSGLVFTHFLIAVLSRRIDPVEDDGGLAGLCLPVVRRADDPDTRRVGVVTAEKFDLKVQLVVTILDTGGWRTLGVRVVPTNQAEVLPVQLLVDTGLQPLGGGSPRLVGWEEAGEGGGDGQVGACHGSHVGPEGPD